jgi:hypothetical protein
MAAVAAAKFLSRFIGECHRRHSDRAEDAAAVEEVWVARSKVSRAPLISVVIPGFRLPALRVH